MPPEPSRRTTSHRPIIAPGPRLDGTICGPLAGSTGDGVPAAATLCCDSWVWALASPVGDACGGDAAGWVGWALNGLVDEPVGSRLPIMPITSRRRPITAAPSPPTRVGTG